MTGKSATGDQKHGPSSHYSVNPKLIRKKKKSFETWERLPVCVKAPAMQMGGPDFDSLGPTAKLDS